VKILWFSYHLFNKIREEEGRIGSVWKWEVERVRWWLGEVVGGGGTNNIYTSK
jgi:hypothetical protein